jgi:hypothetical protein
LLFCDGSRWDVLKLKEILHLYGTATGMEVNMLKSSIVFNEVEEEQIGTILKIFPFQRAAFQGGFKYLGFQLKPNDYRKRDWQWLVDKIEARNN